MITPLPAYAKCKRNVPNLLVHLLMRKTVLLIVAAAATLLGSGFQSVDLLKLRSVGGVKFSPDGTKLAYIVSRNDTGGRGTSELFVMTLADRKTVGLSSGDEPSSDPHWSPDSQWIAY